MRKIPVYALRPGMITGKNIYNPSGNLLLKADARITETMISKLDGFGIPAIYIDDSVYSVDEIEDVISEATRIQAVIEIKKCFGDSDQKRPYAIDTTGIKQVMDKIINELLASKSLMVTLSDIRCLDQYTFGHSVNVCVLSVITGIALNYSRVLINRLAIGALLHDVGKTMIPTAILNKPGALTEEEFNQIKNHSLYGYNMLRNLSSIGKLSAIGAYQHHERYDGSGYPQGLKGKEIHPFGAIIGIVDMFDAMTSDRVYRKGLPTHEAYELLAASGDYYFEYSIVKAFLNHVAAYPTGTYVQLSDNSIGVVTNTRPGLALNPEVKLLIDPDGNPVYYEKVLSLGDIKNLVVARAITDEVEIDIQIYRKLAVNSYVS